MFYFRQREPIMNNCNELLRYYFGASSLLRYCTTATIIMNYFGTFWDDLSLLQLFFLHIKTSQLICCLRHLTRFYMIGTLVLNLLKTYFFKSVDISLAKAGNPFLVLTLLPPEICLSRVYWRSSNQIIVVYITENTQAKLLCNQHISF